MHATKHEPNGEPAMKDVKDFEIALLAGLGTALFLGAFILFLLHAA